MSDVKRSESEILEQDLNKIYLGNLATVDCDLTLPVKGELGAEFTWQSSHDYIISQDGKVTRPQFGAGNRIVTLTVLARYMGKTQSKEFKANVIEKEYNAIVVSAYDVEIATAVGKAPCLPSVVTVQNNLGENAVVPVSWEEIDSNFYNVEGKFTVEGAVKDNVFVKARVIVTKDSDLLCPRIENKKRVQPFGYKHTDLCGESDFKTALERTQKFALSVNDDSMLYNFRIVAGLDTKGAPMMTGWDAPECKLKGHTTGHYLSSLALCYGATKDTEIKKKLDYMITELKKCQEGIAKRGDCKEGFLSAYSEEQFDLLEEYTVYPIIWAPYYTLHKILAGLRDCYLLADSKKALELYKTVGMWVYNRLSRLEEKQRARMWSMYIAGEFGGMNEVTVDLYRITGEEKFLTASRYFDNEKLYLPMTQNIDALGNMHANQHIPQIVGALRQFGATGESRYFNIASNFWEMVTKDHIYSIGGTGETEMFKTPGKIGSYISDKSAESCASYNMLKLTAELFSYNPTVKYMDYYEKTVYNHILSCGDIGGPTGGSTYFMPTSPGAHKHFDATENSCCHGTGLENHFKYQENIYFHDDNAVYVNLYIPSKLSWQEKSVELSMGVEQDNNAINARIYVSASAKIQIKLRKPYWAKNVEVSVDGRAVTYKIEDGYMILCLEKGDSEIGVQMLTSPWLSTTQDKPDTVSLCYGPYVLAALCDEKKFLEFKGDVADIFQRVRLENLQPLQVSLDGIKFVPLCHIDEHQGYHLYIKIIN